MLSSALRHLYGSSEVDARVPGPLIGRVTNNDDPKQRGRVKVSFPGLSEQIESAWAPVVTPMAGPGRGLYTLPEVGDTVVVMFENGALDRPLVIGAIWNGQDKPPEVNTGGRNDRRAMHSRSGHIVRLDDTEGAERIDIIHADGKTSISIEARTNGITVKGDGPVTIAAAGDLELTSEHGAVTIKGRSVSVDAKADLDLTAGARGRLAAQGQLTVQGAAVDIN